MKIVAVVGSLRYDSSTMKAAKVALNAAKAAGAEVEIFDLRERPLPIFDPEDENQYEEENVKYFVQVMTEADGFIIGSPEYHNGISGVLKNALDFVGSTQFANKPVGLVASAGGAVATNTLNQLLTILRSLHAYVVPQFGSVGYGVKFLEDGNFENPNMQERFEKIGRDVVMLGKAMKQTNEVK
jgi:azobenzene reductase